MPETPDPVSEAELDELADAASLWSAWPRNSRSGRDLAEVAARTATRLVAEVRRLRAAKPAPAPAAPASPEAGEPVPTLEDIHAMGLSVPGGADAADYVDQIRGRAAPLPPAPAGEGGGLDKIDDLINTALGCGHVIASRARTIANHVGDPNLNPKEFTDSILALRQEIHACLVAIRKEAHAALARRAPADAGQAGWNYDTKPTDHRPVLITTKDGYVTEAFWTGTWWDHDNWSAVRHPSYARAWREPPEPAPERTPAPSPAGGAAVPLGDCLCPEDFYHPDCPIHGGAAGKA